jgi:hypothetical protein
MLRSNHILIINSCHSFGKTYLIDKISQFIHKTDDSRVDILYYNLKNNNNDLIRYSKLIRSQYLKVVKDNIDNKVKTLILLDNLSILFIKKLSTEEREIKDEIIDDLINFKRVYYVHFLITFNDRGDDLNKNDYLKLINNFECIDLETSEWNCFLSSFLNRRLVDFEVNQLNSDEESCSIMKSIINFINKTFELIQNRNSKVIKSPVAFMQIPFDCDHSEKWFIRLWNYTIIPYLNCVVNKNVNVKEDIQWVFNNYPWPQNQNNTKGSQKLRNIKLVNDSNINKFDDKSNNLVSMISKLNSLDIERRIRDSDSTELRDTSSCLYSSSSSSSSDSSGSCQTSEIIKPNVYTRNTIEFVQSSARYESSL